MTLAQPPVPRGRSQRSRGAVRRVVAVLVGLLFLFPFYYIVATSLNSASQSSSLSDVLLPHWHWENYGRAWAAAPWPRLFLNTVLIGACTVVLAMATSLLAGFAFGVMRFRGRGFLFTLVMAVMMVPGTVLIIPDYLIATDIHWLDTYWIQIVPWGASVFGIFLVRQFFLGLPAELFDAAELDGATRFRMLWSIGLPLVRPALLIIALQVFLASWNSFLWPFIMTQDPNVQPVEVGLAAFAGAEGTDYPGLAAAVVFTTVPVLAFFLVLQRHFVTGAMSTAGGVRG
ncbi:carbohydrate ABC transporter permease [Kitasatospora viridis]|uniref:Carbohydrate ABC transporter membrane protein 2 (CUT1 family) n=1 Tax=Kitasatospora viridis TaxID=281105 RepID=A0A561SE09_9ACTN|nr:carbohydrate ABC transporter permease [Kitasatospora viridis]TWF73101.1 carbohydrate ABC transporter membrane protein 2 (CUT1 family) [Kitasatospora viridis]